MLLVDPAAENKASDSSRLRGNNKKAKNPAVSLLLLCDVLFATNVNSSSIYCNCCNLI